MSKPVTGVHRMFEQQALRTPHDAAVEWGSERLSYADLNGRADNLAEVLRSAGVGPDAIVGMCLRRSPSMTVALLGILKAGGAYMPLDPGLPPQRLVHLLNQSRCRVLVGERALEDRLATLGAGAAMPLHCLWMDEHQDHAPRPARNTQRSPGPPSADHLAYVLFTSGSTGEPKGVAMPHRPLINLIQWQCADSAMGVSNKTLQFASLGFDVSFQEIFATWASGGTLVLIGDETRREPAALLEAIQDLGIERIFLPFFMLERLVEAAARPDLAQLPLREVMVAGEQLRVGAETKRFFERLPGCRVWNHYGPTEAHVVTSCELAGPPAAWPALPPIGKPLPHCDIHILDEHLQPAPPGEAGEIYIGGVPLARGYVNAPELTARRFLTNARGARIYRTGDLGRWLPDGNLEYLGRLDHQVKIRGHRVELGEIEVVMGAHPGLSACAVVPRAHDGGERYLAAYVVARDGAVLTTGTLRQWLEQKLPEYMVPARYFELPALPLTPNGKVDRKALEDWQGPDLSAGTRYVAPRTEMELKLAGIWQQLFHRPGIGCHDNFFELGGHSLMAARLAAEVEKQLGAKLPIAALFQSPTVELLARRLGSGKWKPRWKSLVPLRPLGRRTPFHFIHGWGGDVYCFIGFSQLLPGDQPVYGLQAVGLDGSEPRHTSIVEMAAHYADEMCAFQPDGPFFLGGYSLGGLIAFEVAQQLHSRGRRVALLALLDSEPIGGMPWTIYGRTMGRHLIRRAMHHLRRWPQLPACERRAYLRGRWHALQCIINRNRNHKPAVTAPPQADSNPPRIDGYQDYYLAVACAYHLRPYRGAIDLFVSEESDPRSLSCWRHLARGGIRYHPVPCMHAQIIQPEFVPVLAKALGQALDEAHGREG